MAKFVSRSNKLLLVLSAGAQAAHAQSQPGTSDVVDQVIACRSIVNAAEKVGCYDLAANQLEAARARGNLSSRDLARVDKARRSSFGLASGEPAELNASKLEPEQITEIISRIKFAHQDGNGRWVIILEDDAKWRQAESKLLGTAPVPGDTIRIRKAALGSFLANIEGRPAMRVKRQN